MRPMQSPGRARTGPADADRARGPRRKWSREGGPGTPTGPRPRHHAAVACSPPSQTNGTPPGTRRPCPECLCHRAHERGMRPCELRGHTEPLVPMPSATPIAGRGASNDTQSAKTAWLDEPLTGESPMAVAVRGSNGSSSRSTSPNGHQNGGHDNGHNKGPRRIKVGVIGCGYWGPQLIRNIHEMADAELVGVADTKPERLEFVRRHYPEVKLFSSHTQLLETDVEAGVVSTPLHTHHMLAKEALTAGNHVMVEKPLAASVSESVAVIHIVPARNLIVSVSPT